MLMSALKEIAFSNMLRIVAAEEGRHARSAPTGGAKDDAPRNVASRDLAEAMFQVLRVGESGQGDNRRSPCAHLTSPLNEIALRKVLVKSVTAETSQLASDRSKARAPWKVARIVVTEETEKKRSEWRVTGKWRSMRAMRAAAS